MAKTILDEIIDWKRKEVAHCVEALPTHTLQDAAASAPPARDMVAALSAPGVSLIAEIKRASPSRGLLCPDLDPAALARTYAVNGAAALSVLTDEHFFRGSLDDLRAAREHIRIPVLRKDFTIDPYQVYEARAAGADAVLLIVAALRDDELQALHRLAGKLGMAALVEVHDEVELAHALRIAPRIVGVNNRDLRTFQVDLRTVERLRPTIPPDVVVVAESGVHTAADVARLAAIGVDAMLVGESLVQAQDIGEKVRELVRGA